MRKNPITLLLIIFSCLIILVILFLLITIIIALITRSNIKDTVDILRGSIEIVALVVGAFWVLFKLYEYREFMDWIQLDLDKNLYKLGAPVKAMIYNCKKDEPEPERMLQQSYTHAIEVILKFTNKGKIRVRLYNIQIGINTMRPLTEGTQFDKSSGHLRLTRIFTSGNIVPKTQLLDFPHVEAYLDKFGQTARLAGENLPDDWHKQQLHVLQNEGPAKVLEKLQKIQDSHPDVTTLQKKLAYLQKRAKDSKPIEETSFYYIEPGVEQEITYLALIPQPSELLQVVAQFSLIQKRIFPKEIRATTGDLYPHTVARTYQV
jgi:hypothetical protein